MIQHLGILDDNLETHSLPSTLHQRLDCQDWWLLITHQAYISISKILHILHHLFHSMFPIVLATKRKTVDWTSMWIVHYQCCQFCAFISFSFSTIFNTFATECKIKGQSWNFSITNSALVSLMPFRFSFAFHTCFTPRSVWDMSKHVTLNFFITRLLTVWTGLATCDPSSNAASADCFSSRTWPRSTAETIRSHSLAFDPDCDTSRKWHAAFKTTMGEFLDISTPAIVIVPAKGSIATLVGTLGLVWRCRVASWFEELAVIVGDKRWWAPPHPCSAPSLVVAAIAAASTAATGSEDSAALPTVVEVKTIPKSATDTMFFESNVSRHWYGGLIAASRSSSWKTLWRNSMTCHPRLSRKPSVVL